MIRVVSSELLKLRTTRTFYGLAGAALGLVMLAVVLVLALTDSAFDEDDVRSLLSSAGGAGLMMLILGVVFSAGEYRHGTIAWTLLVTPVAYSIFDDLYSRVTARKEAPLVTEPVRH